MALNRDELLGHVSSDESEEEQGYDSEAAEVSRTSRVKQPERARKRRKLSPTQSDDEASEVENQHRDAGSSGLPPKRAEDDGSDEEQVGESEPDPPQQPGDGDYSEAKEWKHKTERSIRKKERRPGVIYLSSVPPHLRPSALRNLIEQRGFSPITRLFLAPIVKDASKKVSATSKARRSYGEGWIEFDSHKTGKLCAQTLNATPIGGKKGGYYRDDLWNMKYLRGMGWNELMEGVRGERREEEARRDEERRQIQHEAKIFLEGVEEGKRVEGIKEKRKRKGAQVDDGPQRTFKQFEARRERPKKQEKVSTDAQEVLSKIF